MHASSSKALSAGFPTLQAFMKPVAGPLFIERVWFWCMSGDLGSMKHKQVCRIRLRL